MMYSSRKDTNRAHNELLQLAKIDTQLTTQSQSLLQGLRKTNRRL